MYVWSSTVYCTVCVAHAFNARSRCHGLPFRATPLYVVASRNACNTRLDLPFSLIEALTRAEVHYTLIALDRVTLFDVTIRH